MTGTQVVRRSAVHACLEQLEATWDEVEGCMRPLHFGDPKKEAASLSRVALADRGALPRIGVKGPEAIEYVQAQQIPVPDTIYGWTRRSDGLLVVRVGVDEVFLEGPYVDAVELGLEDSTSDARCWLIRREEASFLLYGVNTEEVLTQACAYDLRGAAGEYVMTRVALVPCAILIEEIELEKRCEDAREAVVYHLWTPASYGPYLWDELLSIVWQCGGNPVGDLAMATILGKSMKGRRV